RAARSARARPRRAHGARAPPGDGRCRAAAVPLGRARRARSQRPPRALLRARQRRPARDHGARGADSLTQAREGGFVSIEGQLLGPAALWRPDHPPVRNPYEAARESMSPGQRIADGVAAVVGSWPFIIVQSLLLLTWMAINVWLAVMTRLHPGFLHAW